jgi:hypothetical protein
MTGTPYTAVRDACAPKAHALINGRLDVGVHDEGHMIACLAAPDRTASQVTNRRVESGDRRIVESGDRRAAIAAPQAWREGHLTGG